MGSMSRSHSHPHPSSRTASGKPKAYQFIEGRPETLAETKETEETEENKENRADVVKSNSPRKASQQRASQAIATDATTLPRDGFPSTPATRMPLADLIGNIDELNSLDNNAQATPEDHIQWRSMRSPRTGEAKRTSASQRTRPRSSSPPSSSRPSQKQRAAVRTPALDPAADLWQRYATSSARDGPAPVHLAKLIGTSSPHSEAESREGTVSGLRRWTSCGVEWPSSKAKRRKTRHTIIREQIEEVFADESPAPPTAPIDEAKRVRIGTLIERIQESLAKPLEEAEPQAPSSSSPLPDRSPAIERKSISPVPSHRRRSNTADHELQASLQGARLQPPQADSRASSSFGSAEMDDTVFDNVQQESMQTDATMGSNFMSGKDTPQNHVQQPMAIPSQPLANTQLEGATLVNDDDFDDDLELSDFDADDFDKIATTYEEMIPVKKVVNAVAPIPQPPPKALGLDGDDDFGDDDMDEECFVQAEAAATQSYQESVSQKPHTEVHDRTIQRYRVNSVDEGQYTTAQGRAAPEKLVFVEDKNGIFHVISLRQSWYDTRCTKGSYVHVIGKFNDQGNCVVDDNNNMLILHPDHLISALVVADSFGCLRRAVLQDRIKATSDPSPPQTYGTMLHEIFQEAMKVNRWDTDWLNNTIDMITAQHIEDLYAIKLSIPQAVEHMRSKMPELQKWAAMFVKSRPTADSLAKDRNGKEITLSVNKLLDVEEHVWSPMYGLKGNIDATVQVTMQDETGERTLTVPFEVKTGKNTTSASHRAQTALYTLLLSDRYDISVVYGVLYYMESSEISRIPAIRQELRHMIMQRNELACYIRERLTLPPMLKTAHTCGRCYAKTSCFMYHKLAEDGDGETSGMREKFTELVGHLKSNHQDFFKKWDDLLTKEESEIMKFKRELWTMLSTEREKHGRCFANIRLVPGTASEDKGASKINKFGYTFQREEGEAKNFSDSHIAIGEPIVISDEQGHYALANGYVTEIHKRHITVAVDRRLHNARTRQPGFDVDNNQVFAGIMDVEGPSTAPKTTASDGILYRLDKDEFSNGLATVRNNLIQIMTDSVFHAKEIRDFVVDDVAPRFKTTPAVYQLSGPASQLTINKDQKEAIEKIMTAEDYALVLGMPGTGKTTTIAHIIRALVAKGKSVLLTSYTHTAVDNILLKIRDDNIGVLRLGAVAKIHPEVRQFAVLGAEPKTSIEELENAYQKPQVVATTCLGINHQVFNERIFDYCIVDEASQITLPVCLGPIRMAKTFVLVGDHYQLPPLVQNREAQEGGLDVSLFKLLSERHPEAVVTLRHQYRMNNDIMSISNALIYDGRLVCGSSSVANRLLSLPSLDNLSLLHSTSSHTASICWLTRALSRTSTPVIFLNTDTLDTPTSKYSYETISGSRTTNTLEANLLAHLTSALLLAGLAPSTLGIVTPYRSQLRLIRDMLNVQLSPAQTEAIEAHTADRFQGRDKEVVLMSFVRANDRGIVGELLKDWRRVNVSVTRARSKMVMIGSKKTLAQGDELLAKLVNMCEEKGWMIDLKEGMGVQAEEHEWANAGFGLGASVTPARTRVSPIKTAVPKAAASPTTIRAQAKRPAQTEIIDLASPTKKPAHTALTSSSLTTASNISQAQRARTFGRVLSNGQSNGTTASKPSSSVHKPFKVPRKVGKVNVENTAVGKVMGKSRLLNDVVNDVWGELGLGDDEFE